MPNPYQPPREGRRPPKKRTNSSWREPAILFAIAAAIGAINGSHFPIAAPFNYLVGSFGMLVIAVPVYLLTRDKLC